MKWAQGKSSYGLIHRVQAPLVGTYRHTDCGLHIYVTAVWDERPSNFPRGRLCGRCNDKHRAEWNKAGDRRSMDVEVPDSFLHRVLTTVLERTEEMLAVCDPYYTDEDSLVENAEDLKHVLWHLSNRIEAQKRFADQLAKLIAEGK